MSQPPRPVDDYAPRPARDGAAPGADVLALVDLDAVNARLHALPTAALLTELHRVVAAIESMDPARRRRRAGFFGRLLGRDLVAQAQPDPVETRVRLHLSSARTVADDLLAQSDELAPLAARLRELAQRLRDCIAPPLSPDTIADEGLARRRLHLAAVATTWENAAMHVDQVGAHVRHLLERHEQVRDLLVPAWRQQTSLSASASRHDDEATARLHDALHAQLAAMHRALATTTENVPIRPDTTTTGIDAARATTQEPSP